MSTDLTNLYIDSLQRAFLTTFEWVRKHNPDGNVQDFVESWVDLVASSLSDVRLTSMPPFDPDSPPLRFLGSHRIETKSFYVARSGMRGGPTVDVLLQVWFDTEDMTSGYGLPLVFRKISRSGRLSDLMWSETQDVCRQIALATSSGRLVFLADGESFDWYRASSYVRPRWLLATDMHSFAGGRLPPTPVRGRQIKDFCFDLASGWIGDPALSGMGPSPLLDDLMATLQVSHVLRIKIVREVEHDVWRPVPLAI